MFSSRAMLEKHVELRHSIKEESQDILTVRARRCSSPSPDSLQR